MTPTLSSALTRHLRGAGVAGTGMCSTISHGEIWQLNTLGDEWWCPDTFPEQPKEQNSPGAEGRGQGTHRGKWSFALTVLLPVKKGSKKARTGCSAQDSFSFFPQLLWWAQHSLRGWGEHRNSSWLLSWKRLQAVLIPGKMGSLY